MKTTTALVTLIAVLFFGFAATAASAKDLRKPLKAAKEAFDQRNFSLLKPALENGYMVKGIPAGYEDVALEQFFDQLGAVKSYRIARSAQEGTDTRLYVAYSFENGVQTHFDFLVSANGKFKEFNVLNQAEFVQGDYDVALATLEQAFNQRDFSLLKPVLEDGYTVKGIPAGYESMALEQFFAQVGPVKSYEIQKTAKEGKNVRLYVAYTLADGTAMPFDFLLTEAGKFQELNVLNQAAIVQE